MCPLTKSPCVRYESIPLSALKVSDGAENPHTARLGRKASNRTDTKLREVLEPRAHRASPLIRREHGGRVAASGIRRGGCDCRAKFGRRDRSDPSGDARYAKHDRSAFALRSRHEPLFDTEKTVERMQVALRELEGSLPHERARKLTAARTGSEVGFRRGTQPGDECVAHGGIRDGSAEESFAAETLRRFRD